MVVVFETKYSEVATAMMSNYQMTISDSYMRSVLRHIWQMSFFIF